MCRLGMFYQPQGEDHMFVFMQRAHCASSKHSRHTCQHTTFGLHVCTNLCSEDPRFALMERHTSHVVLPNVSLHLSLFKVQKCGEKLVVVVLRQWGTELLPGERNSGTM